MQIVKRSVRHGLGLARGCQRAARDSPCTTASESVTKTEFRTFTHTALEAWPQIYCFEWMPLVSADARAEFEAEARRTVSDSYQIQAKVRGRRHTGDAR